jgi:hypothetical protein
VTIIHHKEPDVDLYSRDGTKYNTEDALEISRLKARGYTETYNSKDPRPVSTRFNPNDHSAVDVLQYLAENPGDAERVIATERGGKNRATIVGQSAGEGA